MVNYSVEVNKLINWIYLWINDNFCGICDVIKMMGCDKGDEK